MLTHYFYLNPLFNLLIFDFFLISKNFKNKDQIKLSNKSTPLANLQ